MARWSILLWAYSPRCLAKIQRNLCLSRKLHDKVLYVSVRSKFPSTTFSRFVWSYRRNGCSTSRQRPTDNFYVPMLIITFLFARRKWSLITTARKTTLVKSCFSPDVLMIWRRKDCLEYLSVLLQSSFAKSTQDLSHSQQSLSTIDRLVKESIITICDVTKFIENTELKQN